MFYRIKYSILWLLIVTLTLSEASDRTITSRKDGVCDEGIDTSASSEEPFQLFDISNQQYNIAYLTQPGGICECSSNVKEAKHAVIKKELDGRIVLTDAYILCGEGQKNEQVLEELMFDYIKNVPERTLG
uniref:Uncharacterized protein n=1 Tax=Panagrolaimus sp. ES5 TaxID=591445 RepID=A0AC34G4I4_9BILA